MPSAPGPRRPRIPIIVVVAYLYGEWLTAGLFMSLALLAAFVGVIGLGWWVLRGDARNRRYESSSEDRIEQH